MVATVNEIRTDNTIAERSPLVVELVGPAGAGKTTLSQALSRRCERILISAHPFYRRVVDVPFFIRNGLLSVPTFLRLFQKNSRWLTREEIAYMTILRGWHQLLRQRVSEEGTVVVLDQGPVFILAQLLWFGPESLKGRSAEGWRRSMYTQWAATLDMVLWLDTSDAILLERIHARDSWHRVKERSEQEAYKFFTRYRTSFEQVISALTANGDLRVLRFDTDHESLDQIVDKVFAALNLVPSDP